MLQMPQKSCGFDGILWNKPRERARCVDDSNVKKMPRLSCVFHFMIKKHANIGHTTMDAIREHDALQHLDRTQNESAHA